MVLLHDAWGLDEQTQVVLNYLASVGFVSLAPDFFRGALPETAEEAAGLARGLARDTAMGVLTGALAFLADHPRTSGRVGVIGFGMGGALALQAAAGEGVAAAVSFYGLPPAGTVDWPRVKTALQAHFAARDPAIAVTDAEALRDLVNGHGGSLELHVYEAGHGFVNEGRPELHNAEAAREAGEASVAFLHKHLAVGE